MAGRVAVIGAGSSGIAATKCLTDAGFTEIVCFERRDVLGGLWHFKEKGPEWEDESGVNRATVIITSKEFTCFSDYPMPDDCPNFCHNKDVEAYFKDYAKHFGVEKYIRYNTEVIRLKKHSTYNSTGKWEIKVKDHKTGLEKVEVFDFAIVCNGHHGAPHRPTFPGQEKFKGKIIHSKEYKDSRGLEGKRAVVVGIGNSGADVCSELSKYCKVFLATRRGAWIMTRLTDYGMPWDADLHLRYQLFKDSWTPVNVLQGRMRKRLNRTFDHDLFAMTPDHPPGSTHPTLNDELPNRIACGMVKVKPNIRSYTENGVIFEDGTHEDNIDVIILCTGYDVGYKFIDKDIIDIQKNHVSMYKYMFLPDLPKQTIAFLALIQPLGAMFPIAELQSRVAAEVFKGTVKLPSPAEMRRDAELHNAINRTRYVNSQRHTIQVDWMPFMDELAEIIGCKPNLWKLFFTDFTLFKTVMFEPCAPYQYRIHGPNPWPGAKQALLTLRDRIHKPFATRKIPCRQGKDSNGTSIGSRALTVMTLSCAVAAAVIYKARQENIDLSQYLENFKLFGSS